MQLIFEEKNQGYLFFKDFFPSCGNFKFQAPTFLSKLVNVGYML